MYLLADDTFSEHIEPPMSAVLANLSEEGKLDSQIPLWGWVAIADVICKVDPVSMLCNFLLNRIQEMWHNLGLKNKFKILYMQKNQSSFWLKLFL